MLSSDLLILNWLQSATTPLGVHSISEVSVFSLLEIAGFHYTEHNITNIFI